MAPRPKGKASSRASKRVKNTSSTTNALNPILLGGGQKPSSSAKPGGSKPSSSAKPASSITSPGCATLVSGRQQRHHHHAVDATISSLQKLDAHGFPLEFPFNKDNWRYILAEKDEQAPLKGLYESNPDRFSGKPLPGFLHRVHCTQAVLLSAQDRAASLHLYENRLSVQGAKGYAMARATHGVYYGSWYFEVRIDALPPDSAARIGWSQTCANLQAPVGYDAFSYAWRSTHGTVFHQSNGQHYADEGYREGDVIGCFIQLPMSEEERAKALPDSLKDECLFKYKHYLYYELLESAQESLKRLRPLDRSQIQFFKNGAAQGVAFADLNRGTYYPAVSLFKQARVTCNFGPNFRYPPPKEHVEALIDLRPMSERVEGEAAERALADTLYNVHNDGKPTKGTFYYQWLEMEFADLF